MRKSVFYLVFISISLQVFSTTVVPAKDVVDKTTESQLFKKQNLVAWCIVPFDKKKRGPADRAAMLKKLGITQLAYDYRKKHIPTFDEELLQLKKQGIKLTAWWFPRSLNSEAIMTLELFKRHNVHPQLWITGSGKTPKDQTEQEQQVLAEANRIKPIAEAANKAGCKVGLYNHGGWFGNPRNQIAIIKKLNMPNVGIVYNLHHGHNHLDKFASLLNEMKPYLLTLNLNGMAKNGDKKGQKILPISAGGEDLRILTIIRNSAWEGPIGILNHTQEDAELRLKDNLNGLEYLVSRMNGKKNLSPPKFVSFPESTKKPQSNATGNLNNFLATGRKEYYERPLTIECRVKLPNANGYNILLANELKQSGNHWEIFSLPNSGNLTAYIPGKKPDHIHSSKSITDNRWHLITMQYDLDRARLYVDRIQVADVPIESSNKQSPEDEFAIGRLVEGKHFSQGTFDWVHLQKGIHQPEITASPIVNENTVALWKIGQSDLKKHKKIKDLSPLNNPARQTQEISPKKPQLQTPMPPKGVHHVLKDKRLQATLIDQSRDDVFMAVKIGSENRIFVGGSKALFVYEPTKNGGYQPKKTLYHFPENSIIIGLEFRGDDLYVLTDHALYLIPDGRVKRKNLSIKRILWGVPLDLHVSFHCMAWGPDGKLYLNHGDPLLGYGNWSRPDHWAFWTLHTQPEGTTVPYTGAGAVLSINPDGTDLKVMARGLRGPVGLVFDNQWNLFTNDNDHESRPDQYAPARLLHVTPHCDFFWPRGWMADKSPDRLDLLETMIPSLGRGVPCDMVYYDEDYLPEEFRGQLLLCRWGRFSVNSYQLSNRGASFSAKESIFLEGKNNARPTGIAIGPDGRIFVTSLYLAGNVAAPYCPTDLIAISRKDHPPETDGIFNITRVDDNQLYSELNHNSLHRRNRAHQELIRRGTRSLSKAISFFKKTKETSLAYPHLIWLVAIGKSDEAKSSLLSLTTHPQKNIRWQAIRAITQFYPESIPQLAKQLLDDPDPQIQLTGLTSLIDSPDTKLPLSQIIKLAASEDSYLRQTTTMLLAKSKQITTVGQSNSLQMLFSRESVNDRLAGILAAGTRLTVPDAHDIPHEKVKLTPRHEDAFYKENIKFADSDKKVRLTDTSRLGSYSIANRWNSIPHPKEEIELKDLLIQALNDSNSQNRLQAAYYLSLLNDPEINPLIEKAENRSILEQFAKQPLQAIDQIWTLGPIQNHQDGFHKNIPPENKAIDLTAEFKNKSNIAKWSKTKNQQHSFQFNHDKNPTSSQFVYFQFQSPSRTPVLLHLKTKNHFRVWHNGRLIRKRLSQPDKNLHLLKFPVYPGSNDILIRLNAQNQKVETNIAFQTLSNVTINLPEQLSSSLLAQRLSEASSSGNSQSLSKEFLTRNWNTEFKKGDTINGRKLFGSLGCAKCHAISDGQPGGGAPSLTGASRRFTISHLVESVLIPNKQIAEQFQSSSILMEDGKVINGLVTAETENEMEILLSDSTRKTILRNDIEERSTSNLSTMPSGIIKTPEELRDLLAYLMSKNPTPP